MGKAGGKTQLGLSIAVALIALYIGGASIAMHDAFKPASTNTNKTTTTTAAPGTTAVASTLNNATGSSSTTPVPGKHTGSYTWASLDDDNLDDAYGWGMTLTVLGYVFIGVSVIMFLFDISPTMSEKVNFDSYRQWISFFIAAFAVILVVFSGLVSFHNASSRPSLINLKDTKAVRIDARDFYALANTSEATNELCYDTMKTVTNQYDAAKPIRDFKVYHFAVFVAFLVVMSGVALQELKARCVHDEEGSDQGDETPLQMGTRMATYAFGTLTFIMALTFLIMGQTDDRDMLAKSAGTWNPGLNYTGTDLEKEMLVQGFATKELELDYQIEEMINRLNSIPEMEDTDSIARDTFSDVGLMSVTVDSAFIVTCINGTVFKEQGKRLCDSKYDGDTGLFNRRLHFIIAWILYMIAGIQCVVLAMNALFGDNAPFALKYVSSNLDRFLPPYEAMMIAGAFALVTHMNSHTILSNCDILEDTHSKDSEHWFGIYAALIAFSLFTGMLSTIGDHMGNVANVMKGSLMSSLM